MTADAIAQVPAKADAPKSPGWIRFWLFFISFLVFVMVLVGGATRITNSGLSITEWLPITGVMPPMTDADWQTLFQKYQEIPQYKILNRGMELAEFKNIFWWEWAHRLLGRVIGAALLLTLVYYGARQKISVALGLKIRVLGLLVAAQGALGWYMVKSGLVDRVDVSQYRLAAHLLLASVCFAAIIWVALGIGNLRSFPGGFGGATAILMLLLILAQITAGGFVAGLDAGHASDTWPKMDGKWVPDGIWTLQPWWKNMLENALAVQFSHRVIAYAIFVLALLHGWSTFRPSALILAYMILVQIGFGVLTVIFHVKMGIALTHQATALITLAVAVWNVHTFMRLRRLPAPGQR
jgi:cytochrome c oxidase assembly protein subunit 15